MTKKKEDKIVRLLMQIQAIWEQEHPNQILSMSVDTNYLTAFSLNNGQYVMNRTIIKGTEIIVPEAEGGNK